MDNINNNNNNSNNTNDNIPTPSVSGCLHYIPDTSMMSYLDNTTNISILYDEFNDNEIDFDDNNPISFECVNHFDNNNNNELPEECDDINNPIVDDPSVDNTDNIDSDDLDILNYPDEPVCMYYVMYSIPY